MPQHQRARKDGQSYQHWPEGQVSARHLSPPSGFFRSPIGMDDPGREVEGPMALVILGGLVNLDGPEFVEILPPLALHFGRFERADDD